MILDIIVMIVGVVLIMGGANYLTDGSSAVARKWGVSDLVIGLTIVAFGTSAPELAISVISAINGSSGIALGNVVGSDIFNILAIVGIVALIRPIKVERSIMTNEIPLVILSAVVLLVCANGIALDGAAADGISRRDGLILLMFFLIFMRYTLSIANRKSTPGLEIKRQEESAEIAADPVKPMKMWLAAICIIGGLAGLIIGGELFVKGASAIARGLNVSEAVIGLTIVAVGTSLPDMAASVAAALKGRSGLAIGNIIGSNIFNTFFVLGTAATIRPLPMGGITNTDLLTLVGASVMFWLFGWFIRERTITRLEGGIMTGCFVAYTTYLVLTAV